MQFYLCFLILVIFVLIYESNCVVKLLLDGSYSNLVWLVLIDTNPAVVHGWGRKCVIYNALVPGNKHETKTKERIPNSSSEWPLDSLFYPLLGGRMGFSFRLYFLSLINTITNTVGYASNRKFKVLFQSPGYAFFLYYGPMYFRIDDKVGYFAEGRG